MGFNTDEPIDWENINLPDKTDLYFELSRRITNYTNADFIVRIGNDEFHCHLLVLQSYSTFFDEKHCKEIDLTEVSILLFHCLLLLYPYEFSLFPLIFSKSTSVFTRIIKKERLKKKINK